MMDSNMRNIQYFSIFSKFHVFPPKTCRNSLIIFIISKNKSGVKFTGIRPDGFSINVNVVAVYYQAANSLAKYLQINCHSALHCTPQGEDDYGLITGYTAILTAEVQPDWRSGPGDIKGKSFNSACGLTLLPPWYIIFG